MARDSRRPMNNVMKLMENPYSGRGIIVGVDSTGTKLLQIYWIEVRDPSRKNRRLRHVGNRVYTEPIDGAQSIDPLTIYDAMDAVDGQFVVSNGDHTDTIMQAVRDRVSFRAALLTQKYEPDLSHTPRIAAICRLGDADAEKWPLAEIGIVRKSPHDDSSVCRVWRFQHIVPGTGWCIHTYEGDRDPLPTFSGNPYKVSLYGDPMNFPNDMWHMILSHEHRVALAIKIIPRNYAEPIVLIRP